jgi:hypothetical protein
MNKFLTVPLDVVDEIVAGNIDKLAEIIEPLSDSAKMAYVPSLDEQSKLPEKDVALIMWSPKVGQIKKYAMTSPELVELNLAYLSSKKDDLPDEIYKVAGANLAAAAHNHNIAIPDNLSEFSGSSHYVDNSVDIRNIDVSKLITDSSSTDVEHYALSSSDKYPLDTAQQVKKASAYFERNSKKMDPFTALEFGQNVIQRADSLDVPIENTEVIKYASVDFECFNKELYDNINVRKSYLKDNETESHELYNNLLRKSDELGVPKTAELLYEIDKKAELTGNYGKTIEDPVFAVAGKVGSDGIEVDGVYVRSSQLDSIPSGDLTPIVGNDAIDELRGDDKLDVFSSLPRPIRKEIIDLL